MLRQVALSEGIRFAELLDTLPQGVFVIERTACSWRLPKILFANRRSTEMLGVDRDSLTGRSIRCLRAHGEGRHRFQCLVEALAAGAETVGRFPIPDRDGAELNVRLALRYLEHHVLVLASDPNTQDRDVRGTNGLDSGLCNAITGHYFYAQILSPSGVFRFDVTEPGFLRFLSDINIAGKRLQDFSDAVIKSDWPKLLTRQRALLSGESSDTLLRIRSDAGKILKFRDRAIPIFKDGAVTDRVFGALEQVGPDTDQRSAVDAYEGVVRSVAQLLHRLVLLVNEQGHVLWVSSEPATPFANRLRSSAGIKLEALLPIEDADCWLDALDRVFDAGSRLTFRSNWQLTSDVDHLDISLVPLDQQTAMIVVDASNASTVVTDRDKSFWATIDVSELCAALQIGYLLADADGNINKANARAFSLVESDIKMPILPEKMANSIDCGNVFSLPDDSLNVHGLHEHGALTTARINHNESLVGWQKIALHQDKGQAAQNLLIEMSKERIASKILYSEDWMSFVLEEVDEGVLAIDHFGIVSWANQSISSMTNIPKSGLVGRDLQAVFASTDIGDVDGDNSVDQVLTSRPGCNPNTYDLQVRRSDGKTLPVEVVARQHGSNDDKATILIVRDLTNRRQTEETFRSLAYHDPTTGLANRLLYYDRLNQLIDCHDGVSMSAVMLVDLDRFKLINDSLGLERGDQLLKAVADRLQTVISAPDMLARLGGDEFMVLIANVSDTDAINRRAQELIDCLASSINILSHEFTVSTSIGIAVYPLDGHDVETLVKNADTALSRAKEGERGHYQFYTTDMNAATFERLMLENRLRKALDQHELVIYYQPQLSLKTGMITGAEALLRWFHPEIGMVSPGKFIPIAEETGLIIVIGEWVLEQAVEDLNRWHRMGFTEMSISVNISARQFGQQRLVEVVSKLLAATDVPANRLTLELTESVIMRDIDDTTVRLQELRALGIGLSVDDFGTGYSSLGYLRQFPLETLKIDRSFTRDIDAADKGDAIPKAIVAMSSSLGLKVVAEGVETKAQLSALRAYGCDEMQGFLFSPPIPMDQFTTLLEDNKKLEFD